MTERNDEALARVLLDARLLSRPRLQEARRAADAAGLRLSAWLLRTKLLSAKDLARAVGQARGTDPLDLDALGFQLLPEDECRRLRALPLGLRRGPGGIALQLGMSDPDDEDAVRAVQARTGLPVRPLLVDDASLERALARLAAAAAREEAEIEQHFGEQGTEPVEGAGREDVSTEVAPRPPELDQLTGQARWSGDTGEPSSDVFGGATTPETVWQKMRVCCVARQEGLRRLLHDELGPSLRRLYLVDDPAAAAALVRRDEVDEVIAFEPRRGAGWDELFEAAAALPRGGVVLVTSDRSFDAHPGVTQRRDVPRSAEDLAGLILDALRPRRGG